MFNKNMVFSIFMTLKEVTAESPRGGIDIKRVYGEWTTSYLLIRNANVADSGIHTYLYRLFRYLFTHIYILGIYTCAPAGGSQTNIKVHVFLHGKSKLSLTVVYSFVCVCSSLSLKLQPNAKYICM